MPIYRYALQNGAGPNEHLGFIEIPTDREAIVFGHEVIEDILLEPDPSQEHVTLEITEGTRHVDSVPLHEVVRRRAYG